MKKILSFYYLSFPDSEPSDPSDASTVLRVEVGTGVSGFTFDELYELQLCTLKWISREVDAAEYWAMRHTLIVERIEDECISRILDMLVDRIEDVARRIE